MNARIIVLSIGAALFSMSLLAQDYQLNGNLGVGTNPEKKLDVDGDTKLRGDADVDGELKLTNEEHHTDILDNLLILDEEKSVKPIGGVNEFLKASLKYPCFIDADGLVQPVWQAWAGTPGESDPRMVLCSESLLGIGLNFPQAKMHVNGSGIINQKLTIGHEGLSDKTLHVNGDSEFTGSTNFQSFVGAGITAPAFNEAFSIEADASSDQNGLLISAGQGENVVDNYGLRVRSGWGDMNAIEVVPYSYGVDDAPRFVVQGTGAMSSNLSQWAPHIIKATDHAGEDMFLVESDGDVYGHRFFAEKVTVELDPFPDYVFEKDYELLSLEELRSYINENQRLPNMPSAKSIEENGGDLGELNRLLVEKVEELTLYVLMLDETNAELSEENSQLKESVESRLRALEASSK